MVTQRLRLPVFFALLMLFGTVRGARAQVQIENAFPNLTFRFPVDIQAPTDGTDRLFVVGQDGVIWVFENDAGVTQATEFLNIESKVLCCGELGLLGLAFHPDYANNGFFYVNYTAANPMRTVIARYSVTADPDVADPNSELVLLEVDQPFTNHNAGQLRFGPDGFLYVGLGDGGSGGDPQDNGEDPTTLLGSMLRIDVDGQTGGAPDCGAGPNANYTIPADNPFVGGPPANCDEIFAYGLRNPWRYTFDDTGRLWVADVGQNAWEEIDWVTSGGNYGWDIMEGNHCHEPGVGCDRTGLELPVWEYGHDFNMGGFAIIGGAVYNGAACAADLGGQYVYGDNVTGNIWALSFDDNGATGNTMLFQGSGVAVTAFGVDAAGEMYLTDYGTSGIIQTFTCQSAVTITLTPESADIVIPPEGGSFNYDLDIVNATAVSQTIDIWIVISGPGVTRTLGPVTKTLAPGGTLSRTFTQSIPSGAPAGAYTLTGSIGSFPIADDSDGFPFTKQAGSAAGKTARPARPGASFEAWQ